MRASSSKGSILIAALWTMMFFASIAAIFAARVNSQISTVKRLSSAAVSRATAYSGVAYVRALLTDETKPESKLSSYWTNHSSLFTRIPLDEASGKYFSIVLEDEQSKINLNTISELALARMFSNLSAELVSAPETLAKETVAYRTSVKNLPRWTSFFLFRG
jgi:type II secretory pathway component PulK